MLGFGLVLFVLSFVAVLAYMLIRHFGWEVSDSVMDALLWAGPMLAIVGMTVMLLFG
jgi:UPF0716 family protein affecting phage T7 exclusion